ncbi:MAG: hypothetical protein M1826_002318 [Phylliscum demangeonii]|nr:MAG: hypothetical protein M1826_002318 [Phylliscum demangeonii]
MANLREWLEQGQMFVQPESPSQSPSTGTTPYTPSFIVANTFRPFALHPAPNLVRAMLDDLPRRLNQQPNATQPVSDDLLFEWRASKRKARKIKVEGEPDVTAFWLRLLDGCEAYYLEICSPIDVDHEFRIPNQLGAELQNSFTDLGMSVGEEIRAAIELKRDAVYMAQLRQPAPWMRKPWLDWDGMTNVTGLQSIVLKLAVLMAKRNVRWGVLASERQFQVFRLQYVEQAGQSYPYLLMGDHHPIDSSSPAVLSVLVYMLLTGVEPLKDVFPRPAGLKVPKDLSAGLQRTRGQTAAKNRSLADTIARGRGLRLAPGGASDEEIALHLDEVIGQPGIMTMTPVRRTISLTEPGRGRVVPIRVQRLLGSGGTGICLQGMMGTTAVVIKLERAGQRVALANEAGIYEHKLSHLNALPDGLPAPQYFGYFEDPQDRRALVTEYVGPALESFDELTKEMKTDLLRKVRRLHRAGVSHNDLEPRNITCGVEGIKIIDYSHSSRHKCKTIPPRNRSGRLRHGLTTRIRDHLGLLQARQPIPPRNRSGRVRHGLTTRIRDHLGRVDLRLREHQSHRDRRQRDGHPPRQAVQAAAGPVAFALQARPLLGLGFASVLGKLLDFVYLDPGTLGPADALVVR